MREPRPYRLISEGLAGIPRSDVGDEKEMLEESRRCDGARRANAALAALLMLFCLVHPMISLAWLWLGFSDGLAWAAWTGVALCIAHIAASMITSKDMLSDAVRPPSKRKKGHLVRKWVTGCAIIALLAAHLLLNGNRALQTVLLSVFAVALAIHVCVGSKSLAKDLALPPNTRYAIRALAIFVAAVIVIGLVATLASTPV